MDNKQAILGFAEFFKGITGNQNLEIPSEIAEKCGIQAQAEKTCDIEKSNFDMRQYKLDTDTAYECGYNAGLKAQADGEYVTQSAGDEIRQKNYDLINRQVVLDIVDSYSESKSNVEDVTQDIISDIVVLPSVNPQEPKTGHWIIIDDCEKFIAKCSKCGQIEDSRMISKYPYCHCGARMVEPQESEDKE